MQGASDGEFQPSGFDSDTAVAISGLSLRFGDAASRPVLDRLDFVVANGSFVSLIGPSGCGKTTLLKIIADLIAPTQGRVSVDGRSPTEARLAHRYGYVFQSPALLAWRNCRDNVRLPMQVMGWPRARQRQEVERTLDIVGLAQVETLYPRQLSGGMQQRVSIARALSFSPSLLLMDEPFGALDEITREGLNLHLRQLWARGGLTVVFVTHSIPEAVFLSSHVVVMAANPGRIVETIACDLPRERELAIRETAPFHALTSRVRSALERGHAHD